MLWHVKRHHVGQTIPSTFLFHSLEEGAEGELPAAAISCTQFGFFRVLWFLVILCAGGLLTFSILSETNDKGGKLLLLQDCRVRYIL